MATIDKRALRTQRALLTALETLAVTHRYQAITVTLLTQQAGINRKTFYLHYDTLDDLVTQFSDQITAQLAAIIQRRPIAYVYHHPGVLLDDFIQFVEGHSAAVKRVLFSDDYSQFATYIERQLTRTLATAIQASYPLTRQDATITAHFLIHNTLSLYHYFITTAKNGQIDQTTFKTYAEKLNFQGISPFFH